MSINRCATLALLSAPKTTASGAPAKVYTDLLVECPAETSRREQPGVSDIDLDIASSTSWFLPSEKFGMHKTTRAIVLHQCFTTRFPELVHGISHIESAVLI